MKNLMHNSHFGFRPSLSGFIALIALGMVSHAAAADGSRRYTETDLVSDQAGVAAVTDPNLVNPWGLSVSPTGPWWVSDNGSGLSTLYNGQGAVQSLVVTIPNSPGETDPSAPTGTVFNGTTDFAVTGGFFVKDTATTE